MHLLKRAKAPIPRFFRGLRTVGLVAAAVGASLIAAPISLPAFLVTAAGYLTVAGGVIGAVSQLTLSPESGEKEVDDGAH